MRLPYQLKMTVNAEGTRFFFVGRGKEQLSPYFLTREAAEVRLAQMRADAKRKNTQQAKEVRAWRRA